MMSKDKVRFIATWNNLRKDPFRKALADTMGIHILESDVRSMCGDIEITCRPSQFARFLICRDLHGGNNDFKSLNAKLIIEDEASRRIDVSKKPNQYKAS